MHAKHHQYTMIWKLLGETATRQVPPCLLSDDSERGKQFQLLEVVVTQVVAQLFPGHRWFVTPRGGDAGIDFLGERLLLEHKELSIRAVDVMTGQCTSQASKLEMKLEYDAKRMAKNVKPSRFIFVITGNLTDRRRSAISSEIEGTWHRPVLWIGPEELIHLLSDYWNIVESLIRNSLTADEFDRVTQAVLDQRIDSHVDINLVHRPDTGRTGEPFSVCVSLSKSGNQDDSYSWRWLPPTLAKTNAPSMALIRPSRASHKAGIPLDIQPYTEHRVSMLLRGHFVGRQQLGTLQIIDGRGGEVSRFPLGKIDLVDEWSPPFYSRPYTEQRARLQRYTDLAGAGRPVTVAVTGAGGIGKSRLCTEHMCDAAARDWQTISVLHECSLNSPYMVFGNLLSEICGSLGHLHPDRFTRVDEYLSSRDPVIASAVRESRRPLFEYDPNEGPGPSSALDLDALTSALCIAMVERAGIGPVILHIGDLHWLSAHASAILYDFVSRLRELARHHHCPVLLLFEGRLEESLPGTNLASYPWDDAVSMLADEHIVVPGMTEDDSRGLVHLIFEHAETPHRRVPAALVEDQSRLIENILSYSKGSPFHIIEHLKLLLDMNFLDRNTSSGRLFLASPLSDSYQPSASISELIRARLDFMLQRRPRLVRLLAALGFVRNHVPARLLESLRSRLCPEISLSQIRATQMVVSDVSQHATTRFMHEHYFRAAHTLPLSKFDIDEIASCYFEWCDSRASDDPHVMIDRAAVLNRVGDTDHEVLWTMLETAANTSAKTGLHALAKTATDLILNSIGSDETFAPSKKIRALKVAVANAEYTRWTDSWDSAAEKYTAIIRQSQSLEQSSQVQLTEHERTKATQARYTAVTELADVESARMCHFYAVEPLRTVVEELDLFKEHNSGTMHITNRKMLTRAVNRLGVLLWFDGQYEDARVKLEYAIDLAADCDDFDRYYTLVDYATWLSRHSVESAEAGLRDASDILHRISPNAPLRERYMIDFQLGMIELMKAQHSEDCSSIADAVRSRMLRNFDFARRGSYGYEMAGSALVAGAACGLLDSEDSTQWFKRATDASERFGNRATLWTSATNLAQCLSSSGETEAAVHHADRALAVFKHALSVPPCGDTDRLATVYQLPLSRILQVYRSANASRADEVAALYPSIAEFVSNGGHDLEPRPPREISPLYVRGERSDYFLMA